MATDLAAAAPNISRLAMMLAGAKGMNPDDEDENAVHPLLAAASPAPAPMNPAASPAMPSPPTPPAAMPAPPTAAPAPPAAPPAFAQPGGAPGTGMPPAAVAAAVTPTINPMLAPRPVAPTYKGVDLSTRQALQDKRDADAKPIDPNSKDVKPRWWERLLGGLATGAAMYQHNPNADAIGNEIINRRYSAADLMRQQNLQKDDSALNQFDRNAQQARDEFGTASEQFRNDNASYEDMLRQSNLDAANRQPPPDPIGQRMRDADRIGLKGDDRTYYVANGKLKEPNQAMDAIIADRAAARSDREKDRQATRDDRQQQNAQRELDRYNAAKDKIDKEKQAELDKAEKAARDTKTGQITDPETLEHSKNNIERTFADRYNRLGAPPSIPTGGGTAQSGVGGSPKQGGQQGGPSAPKGRTLDPNNPTDMSTAKSYLAKAGGDKVKARQMAAKDGLKF